MDQSGLGFIFDCTHKAWSRPFLFVALLLEICSAVCYIFIQHVHDKGVIPEATFRLMIYFTVFNTICGMVCTYVALFSLTFSQNKLESIASDLNKMKNHLNIDRSPSQFLKEWIVFVVICFLVNAIYFLYHIRNLENAINLMPYLLNLLLCYIVGGQVSCLFVYVKSFYVELMQSKRYEETVVCSQKLSKIVDNICELYKLPILLIVSWLYLLSISNVYFILNHLIYEIAGMYWWNFIIFLGIGLISYPITLIIRSCNGLSQQMKKFNEHLYWIIVNDKSRQLLENERLDLHFIMTDQMAFNACDFFPIDNSLICSMISTATTYLVILLQYGKNDSATTQSEMNATIAY